MPAGRAESPITVPPEHGGRTDLGRKECFCNMNEAQNSTTPIVSVIIPAWNAEPYIEETLRSAMEQTLQNIEIIVVDDCSTDRTAEITERLAAADPRIHCFRNPQNSGVSKTRNFAVEQARGAYIALLDSDDLWLPEKLERQVELIRREDADLVYCSYGMIDEKGDKSHPDFIVPETTDVEHMLVRSVISCSTALIKREFLLQFPFGSDRGHEDYILWLRILSAGYRVAGDSTVLAQYRVFSDSRSGNKWKSAKKRWRIYRQDLGFSRLRSTKYFLRYAIAGIKKYR